MREILSEGYCADLGYIIYGYRLPWAAKFLVVGGSAIRPRKAHRHSRRVAAICDCNEVGA